MREILYYCACGCVNPKKGMTNVKYDNALRLVCKNHKSFHGGRFIKRSVLCEDCGQTIFVTHNNRPQKRCEKCQTKIEAERAQKYKTGYHREPGKYERIKAEGKIELTKENSCDCQNFESCGECIHPFFQCKLFSKAG